jgi:hypothetical protein
VSEGSAEAEGPSPESTHVPGDRSSRVPLAIAVSCGPRSLLTERRVGPNNRSEGDRAEDGQSDPITPLPCCNVILSAIPYPAPVSCAEAGFEGFAGGWVAGILNVGTELFAWNS